MDQSLGALFSGKICMDNGLESSIKVSPETGLGQWRWLFPIFSEKSKKNTEFTKSFEGQTPQIH